MYIIFVYNFLFFVFCRFLFLPFIMDIFLQVRKKLLSVITCKLGSKLKH